MDFTLSSEDKRYISKIIAHYRRQYYIETRNSKWTQESFVFNEYHEKICSRKTLGKIEKGEIILNNEIYEQLLYNIYLKIDYDKDLNDFHIYEICQILCNAIDFYDLDKVGGLLNEIIVQLEQYKEYVKFHEYYIFFNVIKWYYIDDITIENDDLNLIIDLLDMLEKTLQELLLNVLFKSKYKTQSDLFSNIFKMSKFSFNKINFTTMLFLSKRIQEANDHVICIKNDLIKKANMIRLADLLIVQLSFCSYGDINQFGKLIKEIELLLLKYGNKITFQKLLKSIEILGINAYKMGDFDLAEKYLLKKMMYDSDKSIESLILLIDVYEKKNEIQNIMPLLKYDYKINDKHKKIYTFFKMKYKDKENYNVLAMFIINEIIMVLNEMDYIYKKIFYNQLIEFIKITKQYKSLFMYLNKLEVKNSIWWSE